MTSYWLDLAAPATTPRTDLCPEDADVVVVGAGITGLATALLLARAGKQVVVLEARQIGAVTTGHTTGKVSLLQGTKLSRMLRVQSEKVARAYLRSNTEGQAWLLGFCEEHQVPFQRRDAVTLAVTPDQRPDAEAEHRAARRLGLPTVWVDSLGLPFPTFGGSVLAGQAQLDPMPLLAAMAAEVTAHGGTIREGSRVVSVSRLGRPVVRTEDGVRVRAGHVVLATGSPILDRGLYFAKLEANRSYALTFTGAEAPAQMLLSAGTPSRSVRDVPSPDGGSLLMVGGNGHVVGRASSEHRHLDQIRAFVAEHFPGAEETHAWAAQDYSSHDGLPFVGALPRGGGRIHLATGFDKWGLTNGAAAALRLSGGLLGEAPSWAGPIGHRVTRPRGALAMASANVKVGLALARGLVGAEARTEPDAVPEGTGVVGRRGLDPVPVATSTVDGRTCSVIGLCSHLGGVLAWNDADKSWDCPLHGSRFGPDGTVLEGPATRPLAVRNAPNGVSEGHAAST